MPEVGGAFNTIDRFVKDFTWKRVVVWAGLLGLLAAIASLREWYANDFRLARLSEQIEMLERLRGASPGASRDTVVASMYENTRARLRESVSQGAAIPETAARWWHAILGFLPWGLMAAVAISQPEDDRVEDAGWGAYALTDGVGRSVPMVRRYLPDHGGSDL